MMRAVFIITFVSIFLGTKIWAQTTEAPQSFLSFSAGYSEQFGTILGLDMQYRSAQNGNRASASGLFYDDGYRLSLRFSNALPQKKQSSLFYGIYYEDQSFQDVLFNARRYGGFIGQEHQIADNAKIVYQYNLYRAEIFDVSTRASPLIAAEDRAATGSGLEINYHYKKKDFGPEQRLAFSVNAGFEAYGLGGDAKWANTLVSAKLSYQISPQLKLRLRSAYGIATAFGGYNLRVTDRAFLSSNAPRGFAYTGIGPSDSLGTDRTALGGEQYAVVSFELEHDFFTKKSNVFSGMIYADFGSLWGLNQTSPSFAPIDDGFSLRRSVGLALLWRGKIGTFSASYSKVLKREANDIEQPFQIEFRSKF